MMYRRRTTRRRLLSTAAAASGALWLAACGGSKKSSQTSGSPAGGQSAGTPKKGGTLHISQPADILPDAIPLRFSPPSNVFVNAVFDLLVAYDPKVNPVPKLASSWEWSPDFLQLTLKLRPNATFHSGRPFTSEDAAFTIKRAQAPEVVSQYQAYASLMKPQTPDPTTLVIKFDAPRKSSFDALTGLPIVDRDTIDQMKEGKQFVGTGPFRFKEWAPGDHVSVVRNPDYWQPGKPYLDQIEVKVLPDAQSALVSLESGATDFMLGVEGRDAQRLKKDAKYQVVFSEAGLTYWYAGLDIAAPGLGDKRVRQAIGYSIDRQRLIDTALFGFGRPASTFWPQTSLAYDQAQDQTYKLDVQKAKQLLQAAGWDGKTAIPFKLNLSMPPAIDMAQALQPDLESAGIKMAIDKLDNAIYSKAYAQRQMNSGWISVISLMQLSPPTFTFAGGAVKIPNPGHYESPQYAALIDKALAETDNQQLKETMKQITQIMLDEAWVLPIADSEVGTAGITVARSAVKNITWDINWIAFYRWEDVWLA